MMDEGSIIGTTVSAIVVNTSGEYPVAKGEGNTIFVSGEVSVGSKYQVRIIQKKNGFLIGVSEGAELRLRVDKISEDEIAKAFPEYGPVDIEGELSRDDWYVCRVDSIEKESVKAKALRKIPPKSSIESGPPPDSPTQSLNHLINNKENDS